MTQLELILILISGVLAIGFVLSAKNAKTALDANDEILGSLKEAVIQRDTTEAKLEKLEAGGIALPPECDHCGQLKLDSGVYKELVSKASEAHAFACPQTLARVPHYAAIVRREKEDKEEMRRTPVEVVIESHKSVAEEARKYGVKSLAELRAAKKGQT